MPDFVTPGVYVEEIPSGSRPIEGVGTTTAGLLGITERGPESPQLISSWLEYQRVYGSHVPDLSFLAYAVQGFFDNGGRRCYIGRIVHPGAAAATKEIGGFTFAAVGRGEWGNKLRVKIEQSTQAKAAERGSLEANWVKVTLSYGDAPVEIYDNLALESGAENSVLATLNGQSSFVRVRWKQGQTLGLILPNGEGDSLSGGSDGGAVGAEHFDGHLQPIPLSAERGGAYPPQADLLGIGCGLAAFTRIDEIALLAIPDEVHPAYFQGEPRLSVAAIKHCATLKDRFAIVSVPEVPGDVKAINPPHDTSYAAYYYPWIKVFDPTTHAVRSIPPTGHIAGIFARTDIERGVHKAPANAVLRGAVDLQLPVSKADQDILNPRGVNCIRDFRSDGRGIRLWGARTMSSDPEWKYVNVRRLLLFIEESVEKGTQWVIFEPNDDATWANVTRTAQNFLLRLWRDGALMGTTPEEAFFVRCDRSTMTQDDIDDGQLICLIGVAPVKPAEFVIFRIRQKTADAVA